jgi:hypothetical protein
MAESVDELRSQIVGVQERGPGPRAPAPRRARRRYRSIRLRAVHAVLAGAALLAAALAGYLLLDRGGPSEPVKAAMVTSRGSGVERAAAPSAPVQPALAARPAALTIATDAPPLPVTEREARRRLDAAELLASAAPLAVDGAPDGAALPAARPLSEWSAGGCGGFDRPSGAAFCVADGVLYLPEEIPAETRALFGFAREIGTHLQAEAGLDFAPASGETETLRLDCLAGVWAGVSDRSKPWLNPSRLALVLDGRGLESWIDRRVGAFQAGYAARDVAVCGRLAEG